METPGFNKFRGKSWMKEPCKSCPEQNEDLGGCRCQAYMLTGDPANADPVCDKSEHHAKVIEAVEDASKPINNEKKIIFRTDSDSRKLMNQKINGGLDLEKNRLFEDSSSPSDEKSRVGSSSVEIP